MQCFTNNNFKKISLFVMLILYSSFVVATSKDLVSDKGIITLNIINRPPVITELYFNSEIAFKDSKLECIATINDENVDETKLIYKWYVNNELVEASDNYLTGFNENDLVRCEITPIDNENIFGKIKNVSITINKESTLSTITRFFVKNYNTNFPVSLTLFFDNVLSTIFL